MKDFKEFNNILIKSSETLIDKKLSNIYYDKTFPSVVYGKNDDGTYKIIREGKMYNVPCALGYEIKTTQHVWVTMPCGANNFKDMYISGIRGKSEIVIPGGGSGGDSDNTIERITNEEIDSLFK